MRVFILISVLIISLPALPAVMPSDSLLINIALAENYKKELQYEKALSLYSKLYRNNPDMLDLLVACAETEVLMGNEKEALDTYNQILNIDPSNLDANIYVGNYYYLKAEAKRKKLDDEYTSSTDPTKQKNLNYKKNLKLLYLSEYAVSKKHLENVIRNFPSTEAKRTLEKIGQIEKFVKD